ncbi:tetratricopeptide repeat protein 4 isoform X1 [Thalassophryne amazonica]|uniref:tetratricopeptide repeat protein 4 isoform X1 n=1 Tax=Thalassophryne amazonica TaxID=390379 RepID=UPI001470D774|nr:tetratricopeptide repeat protein 4 isoform X1 [Thalassophryne amazonica]XP_034035460.1 tetratricopeptide repeat protein 4 isoform X1 [Thalassophryne amazonica]
MNQQDDSDDGMDEFYDKFKTQRYRKGFNENNWEEEFDKVPMFMKTAPEDIDPNKYPELACLQAVIHNEDRPPEEQAKSLKDEGNAFFKEKNYQKSILSYTAALKKQCGDQDLNTVLLTNRAAAHFHIGNMRSALNDAAAAKKIKPDHLKALIRGAQCCIKLRLFAEAVQWCDEGLKFHPSDRKLQELRAAADQQKRAADRDARKAKAKEKKLHGEKEALLAAIKERGIKLHQPVKAPQPNSDSEDEGSSAALAQLKLDGLSSQEATGAQVFMDTHGSLHWPVLFLYPEHQQSDFISAFCESSCFLDHLVVMFGEELPPWDTERKYLPSNLQLFFENCEEDTLYQVEPEKSLLEVLQHKRVSVRAGTPSFIVLVHDSSFRKQFLTEKKIHRL